MKRGAAVRVALLGGVLALVAIIGPPAVAAPPDDTFELFFSPDSVTQGDVIEIHGTCWTWTSGAPQQAFVLGDRRPEHSGVPLFEFHVFLPVSPQDGSWSGELRVPLDAPEGLYTIYLSCKTQDQSFGSAADTFVVEGSPVTTTTTTSPKEPQHPAPPTTPPPPADAVDSEATFTG